MSRILVCLAALGLLLAGPVAARAADPSVVTSIRITSEGEADHLVVELDGAADPQMLALKNPFRLTLDLDDALSAAVLPDVKSARFVRSIKQGLAGPNRYRLLMELKGPVRPDVELKREDGKTRISLTLAKGKEADFTVAARARDVSPAAHGAPAPSGPFVVVIDPGHGGVDRGATGEKGTEEKAVNLAFGLALREALSAFPNIKVEMTREDDTFIPLNERAAIARRAKAGLFVSLHADSIRFKDLRGATVYTLSEKASDGLARELAESENSADRFAGAEWDQDAPEIHDILVDLVRQETEGFSEHFALSLVGELKTGGVSLINNPKRSAGFRVLRAPDVPSVLVEMGYLSNEEEEKLLTSPEWQKKVASILARSIEAFSRHRSIVDQRGSN
ncbi:N-acetylmuramoyl-L-alanine amidase [Aureimonas sp. AU40]|uniref:N-acetylmuramoyl-L-alanine amidase n=1 Tax=Aureimonas sp. AU40 TaxID=1637747 RepID=UPI0009E7716A|nr:N-acetylmuramoyl-L-alanine amidase [Aureimonas sp. AU40]